MTGTIQGQDAVLSFYKNDWLPFVCSSDISVAITANKAAVRTAGSGRWKKYTYQDAEYVVTLSGLLKFDDANFSGWDILDNQLGFTEVQFRVSFDDELGNVRSVQGFAIIETSSLSISPGALVKHDFQLTGNGEMIMFDGLIPCPTVINSITVNGQTASDGIVHVTYTETGDVYQVKYRIDGQGDYVYALGDLQLDIPGIPIGDHSIEIIPVCQNGFEGTGMVQPFTVTQAQTCSSSITAITISGGFAVATATGPATQMKWNIDGGVFTFAPINAQIPVSALNVGQHVIQMIPVCSNGVNGTGIEQLFTISQQPAQSILNYTFIFSGLNVPTRQFYIYVNGILVVNSQTSVSGSITVPTGASVKAQILCLPNSGETKHISLNVQDNTTNTVLLNETIAAPNSLPFTWTANGDTYSVTETISD